MSFPFLFYDQIVQILWNISLLVIIMLIQFRKRSKLWLTLIWFITENIFAFSSKYFSLDNVYNYIIHSFYILNRLQFKKFCFFDDIKYMKIRTCKISWFKKMKQTKVVKKLNSFVKKKGNVYYSESVRRKNPNLRKLVC